MRRVISVVSGRLAPSRKEQARIRELSEKVLDKVEAAAAGVPGTRGAHIGGSLAKGTWLAGDADIDIFVGFARSVPRKKFEKDSKKIGFDSLKGYSPYIKYMEHPYVEAAAGGTRINVVPYYDSPAGKWKSAADRSPYHTRLMRESLTPAMRADVRVLKALLKANGIYGAEIARQGFSGYVSEVLVLEFGSFEGVVRGMAGAARGTIIGRTSKKFDTAITIADPVDAGRNLAAAVSVSNMARFVLLCRAFAAGPSEAFFKKKRPRASGNLWDDLLVVSFEFKERSPDMIWGQAKRAAATLTRHLEMGGFRVLRSKAHVGERAHLFFLLESGRIPPMYRNGGPDVFMAGGAEKFIGKSRKEMVWVGEDGRIASLRRRQGTDAAAFMRRFLGKGGDVPSGLQEDLARGYKVVMGGRNLGKSIKEAAAELVSTDGAFLYPR